MFDYRVLKRAYDKHLSYFKVERLDRNTKIIVRKSRCSPFEIVIVNDFGCVKYHWQNLTPRNCKNLIDEAEASVKIG